jgi:hypothetical protein
MLYNIISLSNVISFFALIISLASIFYLQRNDKREEYLIKLKHDKSILYPLLQDNYDYFLTKSKEYDIEKLEFTIKLLKIDNLHNRKIKDKIVKLRSEKVVFIEDKGIWRTVDGNLENLFLEIRYYLSEII